MKTLLFLQTSEGRGRARKQLEEHAPGQAGRHRQEPHRNRVCQDLTPAEAHHRRELPAHG